jgi:CubicO group peptidase (beta-lactamase class C family)
MLKLGQLYLDEGRWHGKQLLRAYWIQQTTAADAPNGFGYLWWIHPVQGQHGYAAVGGGGQVILLCLAAGSSWSPHHASPVLT